MGQYAFGQAGFIPQADHELRHGRSLFTGLEHNRIAGQQRRHDVSVWQMSGKVVRTKHGHHSMGPVLQDRVSRGHVRLLVAGPLMIGLDGEWNLADHGRHFCP